jgi:hypothetical protein
MSDDRGQRDTTAIGREEAQPIAEAMMELFRGLTDSYGVTTFPKGGKKEGKFGGTVPADSVDKTDLSVDHFIDHLLGITGLGIVPVDRDGMCLGFAAIDWDKEGEDHAALSAMVRRVDLPLVVVVSPSKKVHLFAFFREAIAAKHVRDRLSGYAIELKLGTVEVFPKQTIVRAGGSGSYINLPYFGALSGADYHQVAYVDGEPVRDVDQFLTIAKATRPVCMAERAERGIFPHGERDNALFNARTYALAKGADVEAVVQGVNAACSPPFADGSPELRSKLDKRRTTYTGYLCLDEGGGRCKNEACKARRWGSRFVFWDRALPIPADLRLIKVLTNPPHWKLRIAFGDEAFTVVLGSSKQVQKQEDFRARVMNVVPAVMPPMKPATWAAFLQGLLDAHETEEAPEEVGAVGRFDELLADFLERRESASDWEDVLLGNPYEEDDLIWFRSADLLRHLERARFWIGETGVMTTAEVWDRLRTLNGGRPAKKKKIKGRTANVWAVPVSWMAGREQTEPFDERITPEADF